MSDGRAVTGLSPCCKRYGGRWPPMSATTTEESVMGQVIQRQHPAVVLKSHYKAVRALLAAALVAIVALAATVVILANDADKTASSAPISAQAKPAQQQDPGVRFDGGPNEGTRGISDRRRPPGGRPLRRRPGRGLPRRAVVLAAGRAAHELPADAERGLRASTPPRRPSRWAPAAASRTRFHQAAQTGPLSGGPVSRGPAATGRLSGHQVAAGVLAARADEVVCSWSAGGVLLDGGLSGLERSGGPPT